MEDDRVPLSPSRHAGKIVSQSHKSFEDLLEEAVTKKKKKKRRRNTSKTVLV